MVYIAAEKRQGMWKPEEFLEKHIVSFPFLLDEDRHVTKAYGVYHRLGKDAIHIARPATFVVSSDGIIRFLHVGRDQTDRADVEKAMAAVRAAGMQQE